MGLSWRKVSAALGATVFVTLLSLLAFKTETFQELEYRTWDWRVRTQAKRVSPDPKIKIITIDQRSLEFAADELGVRWLWPRDMYEPIVQFLEDAGAKAAAFDILFTESTEHGYELDLSFANVVGGPLPVVSAVVLSKFSPPESEETLNLFHEKATLHEKQYEIPKELFHSSEAISYPQVTLPFPELMNTTSLFGSVKSEADSDGVYRHARIGGLWKGIPVLNLPFALYSAAYGDLHTREEELREMLDQSGRLTLQFLGSEQTIPTYSFAAVLTSYQQLKEGITPNVDPSIFKDSLVLIGMTAPGLKDLRPTPLGSEFPGVEYNATVLDNLLRNRFVEKSPTETNIVYIFFITLLIAISVIFSSGVRQGVLFSLFYMSLYIWITYFFAFQGVWLPLFIPLFAMILALICGLGAQYYFEGRQRSFIRGAFGHFVSPHVIDEIVSNPERLALGGERRELTIFFSDIAGFTSLSEHLPPERLVKLLNEYLTELTDIILSSGGTLDKYEGDAIIAFWNAPLDVHGHADVGVEAALKCQARLEELRDHFEKKYEVFPNTRIGMNSGVVTVGNFGSESRFDYTMIGDAVNLAARLEGVNKVFDTNILISGDTFSRLKNNTPCRRIGTVRVVGKKEIITLYEPLLSTTSVDSERFESALRTFEEGKLDEALELFQAIKDDKVADLYSERIRKSEDLGAENFSPVWNLTSK